MSTRSLDIGVAATLAGTVVRTAKAQFLLGNSVHIDPAETKDKIRRGAAPYLFRRVPPARV
ncbi:MAG TPA: hypothetical protein VND65_21765 [Candidatus Binatia bacterium]|nr:hypothetical protein [Candidatus Binatia bacterium]